mmetsp:Transcript_24326/g.36497  ORF Transcript_24326/g.36497 Transcript_24326/m.36497 type:complete len:273 (-) Transcript_24326:242-1060(-)
MGAYSYLWDPYIVLNSILVLSYVPLRTYFSESSQLFKVDPMGITREMQIFGVLAMAGFVKYRRSSSLAEFFSSIFMYAKTAILICTYVEDYRITLWYGLAILVLFFTLHQKEDKSSCEVTDLNTGNFSVVEEDSEEAWLVEFYTTWAANCLPFTYTFNDLSRRYGKGKLKFGKVDIGRFTSLAKKFKISTEAVRNNELPTLILFEKGKPVPFMRLPRKTPDGELDENFVLLTKANIINFFRLDERLSNEKKEAKAAKKRASSGNNKKKKKRQ